MTDGQASPQPKRARRWRPGAELRPLMIAMLSAASLLAVVEFVYLSHSHEAALHTQASIVAHTVNAAALFDSPRDASDSLEAFRAVPDITEVELLRADGSTLARYRRDEALATWWQGIGSPLRLELPVMANDTLVATLHLTADRGSLWATLTTLLAALLAVMLVATGFTQLVSRRMRAAVRDAEDRTRYLAHHDALTGLANRASFSHALEQAARHARERAAPALLMCLDVDDFKQINDTRGHAAGDDALRTVAAQLRELVREGDMVARLGGDEFAVLLTGARCEETGQRVAREILARLPARSVAGAPLALKVSIGLSRLPEDADTAHDAMQCSDVALYEAKRNGKGMCADYSPALGDKQRDRLRLQSDLREAIANQGLSLAYQPIFDTDGAVRSMEALARWTHPTRGPIGPGEFIPIAEESGLIVDLTLACMSRVRADIDAWRGQGLQPVPVALNISSELLRREADRTRFLEHLAALRLQPDDVEFELTESVLFDDLNNPGSILVRLQAMGYSLAIDDFGTGYSSLAYLRRIRCRKLKIDRVFVSGLHADRENALMVESIVRVAHALDMVVVAEGVELPDERLRLIELGCDLFQGFGLARPQAAADVVRWLATPARPAASTVASVPAASGT
jgi:diguanylate cyclase (GGDEF)-like protein